MKLTVNGDHHMSAADVEIQVHAEAADVEIQVPAESESDLLVCA